jgi:hypothetical protein
VLKCSVVISFVGLGMICLMLATHSPLWKRRRYVIEQIVLTEVVVAI